ncbi:LysR family transcriptional regulator [Variovorax paradoxus]|uniref:LysR family transcriptional regulator n=1 Tax=Variovorax paradoxus TaxID=34073 RepID=UPI00247A5FA4
MAVVDEDSFVAGGKATSLSHSAAGKAVGWLPDRLGLRLLHRTTRTLEQTDEGPLFYEQGAQIPGGQSMTRSQAFQRAGKPRRLLRLSVPDA